jgi:hypothetical protein
MCLVSDQGVFIGVVVWWCTGVHSRGATESFDFELTYVLDLDD